jgi:hypothetical protein
MWASVEHTKAVTTLIRRNNSCQLATVLTNSNRSADWPLHVATNNGLRAEAEGDFDDHRDSDYGPEPLGLVPCEVQQRLPHLVAMTATEVSILIWAVPSLILVPILLRLPRRGDEW